MSLEERLNIGKMSIIGPELTKVSEDTFLLKVIRKLYSSYKIKEKLDLGGNLPIIIADLPSRLLNKNFIYLSKVFFKNEKDRDMRKGYSYIININLEDALKLDYDYLKDNYYVLKVYRNSSIAYVDSSISVRDQDYIIVKVNTFSEKKISKDILDELYNSLFNFGVFVKYI